MAIETMGAALGQIQRLFDEGVVASLSDAQLLDRFRIERDAAAFEAIVARHGPMVLSVCRGLLRDSNDSEDAFQATFLILVKKADSIRGNVVLGGWLYKVAYRVAIQANKAAARRRLREREAGQMAAATSPTGPTIPDELLPTLHEEIARLPDRLRLAVLLCDLEGKQQAQAAGELSWSERTLRRRLAEARLRLKARLGRRGLAPDEAMLTAVFVREARAVVPAAWRETALRAAMDSVNHAVTAGAVSIATKSLTREVLKTMLIQKLTLVSAALLAVGAGGFVASTLALAPKDGPEPREKPTAGIVARPEPGIEPSKPPEDDTAKPIPISGRVLDPDGKPFPGATIYVQHHRQYHLIDEPIPIEAVGRAGADGLFRFDLDPKKSSSPIGESPSWRGAMIAAVAPGFGPAWVAAGDAARAAAELRLARDDLPIRGRIIDSQGRAVASATIRVQWLASIRDGVDLDALLGSGKLDWDGNHVPTIRQPIWTSPGWIGRDGAVTTDADGRFELKGLGRDRTAVLRIYRQGLEKAYIAVLDRAPRRPRRPPGQLSPTFDSLYGELGLELYRTTFEHVVGPSKPISGVVRVKGSGQPVAGVIVAGQVTGKIWAVVMTETDDQGHFRIDGLPKGSSYKVDTRPEPGTPYLGWRSESVGDTESLKPIAVTLEVSRGVAVRGRLIDKMTGRAVPCDWIQYHPLPGNPEQGTPPGTSSGIDHSFRITVPPGRGMIAVKARGKSLPYPGARLDPADRGKLQIKGEDGSEFGINLAIHHAYRFVDFPEGTESATLDMEVTPGISRRVELVGPTGRPLAGASAMGLTTDPFASSTIEGVGFEVQGLRPGESRLVEIRHEELGLGGSVTVTGSEPENRPIVVKLVRFASIAGCLFDEDRLPLRGARVTASVVKRRGYGASNPEFRQREAVADGEGRFRIEGINPTLNVSLWFHKPGAPPYSRKPDPDKDLSNLITKAAETLELGDITVRFNPVQ